jgi:hypothetical protein
VFAKDRFVLPESQSQNQPRLPFAHSCVFCPSQNPIQLVLAARVLACWALALDPRRCRRSRGGGTIGGLALVDSHVDSKLVVSAEVLATGVALELPSMRLLVLGQVG